VAKFCLFTKSECSQLLSPIIRWILKREYLTSCIEAGKFVDEEPFEWFGTGFNDGETISFDAPRKWRNIRQQMGHGAFYGMQIVVYGQLISPTLVIILCDTKVPEETSVAL
jgi:topoisomerase (DNA) II binding protein 1